MKTYALIPGSFKPAHRGHYEMIKWYSTLADEVIVVLSEPKKPRVSHGGISISAEDAKKILDIYCDGLKNVRVEVVKGSPVTWCIEYTEKTDEPSRFYIGCSSKGEDGSRGLRISSYIPHKHVVCVEDSVFNVEGDWLSSTDFRNALDTGDADEIEIFLPKHLNKTQKSKVKNILLCQKNK